MSDNVNHTCNRMFVIAAMLLLIVVSTSAQHIEKHKRFVDYRAAEVHSIAALRDTVYAAIWGGTVVMYDSDLNYLGWREELEDHYVSDLFDASDFMFAVVDDGSLIVFDDSISYINLGRYTAKHFRDTSNTLFFLQDGLIKCVQNVDGHPRVLVKGPIAGDADSVSSFVVVSDTVLVRYKNSRALSVQLLSGDTITSITLPYPLRYSALYGIADGGVVFVGEGSVIQILKPGTIHSPQFITPTFEHEPAYIDGPRTIFKNDSLCFVARTHYWDSVNRVTEMYCLTKTDIPAARISAFDSLADDPVPLCRTTSSWISPYNAGAYAITENSVDKVNKEFMPGLRRQPHVYVVRLSNNEPIGDGQMFFQEALNIPALFNEPEEIEFPFAPNDVYPSYFVSYHKANDNSECALFSDYVLYRESPEMDWDTTRRLRSQLAHEEEIYYLEPSTIAVMNRFRTIEITTDNGKTWQDTQSWNKSYVSDVIISGDHAFILNRGIKHFRISELRDTGDVDSVEIDYYSPYFSFIRADSLSVSFVRLASWTDPSWDIDSADHIVVYQWTPSQKTLDSTEIALSQVESSLSTQLFACMFNDTINILFGHSRLVRVFANGIVFDSQLRHNIYPLVAMLTDEGIWWLCNGHANLAIGMRVGTSLNTSVSNNGSYPGRENLSGHVALFPNPTQQSITITVENASPYSIDVVDQIGCVMQGCGQSSPLNSDIGARSYTLDVSGLAPGTYNVVVRSFNGSQTKRFVVLR